MQYLDRAVELSKEGMERGDGGPFGAVIVCEGEIVSEGNNRVLVDNDPTAHAEVVAIRRATAKLGRFSLSDCELYTSCEPCPMCLGAIYWARPKAVYYANTKHDAAEIEFDDSFIYDEIALKLANRKLPPEILLHNEEIKVFEAWTQKEGKTGY